MRPKPLIPTLHGGWDEEMPTGASSIEGAITQVVESKMQK